MKYLRFITELLRIRRKNWKAVLLSAVAATIFWFFNALNKQYTANIELPIEFEYSRSVYLPVSYLPEKIRINVSGQGWTLLRKSTGVNVPPLSIPLEEAANTRRIVGSSLQPIFASQLPGLEVHYVLEDTLLLHLDHRLSKTVHVIVQGAYEIMGEGIGLAGPVSVFPDSVVLTGPRALLDPLNDTLILTVPVRRITADYQEDLAVQVPSNEFIVRDPPVVSVSIPVDRAQDFLVGLPLEFIHRKPGLRYEIPDSISFTVSATAWCLDLLQGSLDRKAVVDVVDLQRGSYPVAPYLANIPPCVLHISSDSVTVTIH